MNLPQSGIVHLPHLSTITLTGANTAKFLQGQLTCDVNKVNATHACIGSYCNIKGRVLSVFQLFQVEHNYFMLMPSELIPAIAKTLNKYGQFSRINIDTTVAFKHVYGLIGEHPFELPSAIGGVIATDDYLIIRYPGKDRFLYLSNSKPLTPNQPTEIWQAMDIMMGLPEINCATSAEFTPHMLNLKEFHAVSFTKGCYLGQEIIARTEHLGKAKRGLYWCQLSNDAVITPNTSVILNDVVVGTIINSVRIDGYTTYISAVMNLDIDFSLSMNIETNIISGKSWKVIRQVPLMM